MIFKDIIIRYTNHIMDEDQLIVLKKFPLLLPQNESFTMYEGFLHAGDEDFHISLNIPHYPSLTGMAMHCSWELSYTLQGHEKELQEWTNTCLTLSMYLESLQNLIISSLKTRKTPLSYGQKMGEDGCSQIMSDLEEVGLQHVVFLSRNLTQVKLQVVDDAGRSHILTLGLGTNYPQQPLQIHADLPQQVLTNIKKNSSLVNVYRSFGQQVAALQNLWSLLDTLDSCCWVLDPDKPSRKDISRRIVIGTNVSIHVTLDPGNVTGRPNIKFLGPDSLIAPFRESFATNLEKWQCECSVVDNLLHMLDLASFPVRPPPQEQDMAALMQEGECCICYAQRLEGELPVEICEDTRCASPFHTACLFQWLQTVPGNYQSFNRIYGDCPNCGNAISCNVPS